MAVHPSVPRSPRHPNWRTLAFAWAGVLGVALVAAVFFAIFGEDDPNADEGAGIGAVAALVGLVVTFVYVTASVLLDRSRRHPSGWVVAAIVLGGISLGLVADLLEAGRTVDSIVSFAVLALIGVYVAAGLQRRRST